jgi:hypothetical protein
MSVSFKLTGCRPEALAPDKASASRPPPAEDVPPVGARGFHEMPSERFHAPRSFFYLGASQSFSLSRRETGISAFLVVDHFPFAFSLKPAGFSLAFVALGAMLTESLSIRRSLVRPGLPANRT